MSRFLARLLGLVVGLSIAAGVAGSVAALRYRRTAPPVPDAADDEIELVAVMDGRAFRSTAGSFLGGRAICWYAGLDLDLREATLDPAGARLEVRTAFGGTRVIVAPGVRVALSGPAIFGARMDRTDHPAASMDAARLDVSGFTVFGGLQVVTAERGEEVQPWAAEPASQPAG